MPQSSRHGNLSGIYAITPPTADPFPSVEAALREGIALLQYRDKSDDHPRRLNEAQALQALCKRYGTPLLINDDVTLAQQVGAAGVHLGQDDTTLNEARQALGPEAIIGITCHDRIDLALAAQAAGADYVAFGRFFPSSSKPDASPAPLSLLQQARAQLRIPICVIGGINAHNGGALVEAGADLLAVIDGLFGADDIPTACAELKGLFPEGAV